MENLWKSRKAPVPLAWNEIPETGNYFHVFSLIVCILIDVVILAPSSSTAQNNVGLPDMQVWDLSKCAKVFAESIKSLKEELEKKETGDYLVWDKDDKPAMEFVTACANIRSHIFGIDKKSLFDAKCMYKIFFYFLQCCLYYFFKFCNVSPWIFYGCIFKK